MDAIVKSRINHVVQVSREIIVAGTYVYPLKGVYYLLTHPNLYGMVTSRLLPTMALGLIITTVMFFFTYVPQAALLTLLNGPFGVINAVSLVLSESATVTMMLARNFTLKETLVDIFDATLVSEGEDNLVSKGRELKAGRESKGASALGKNLIKLPER
ncbi:hypothetical protein Clacol_009006 [Clathrus columnatus]|uniref:Uncharacterized protein n=1 Tax=Clathrus columnatus TaxID=1419009 RepID=A0AAV5APW6_9AGAM|nr:hypothetical protein Clacol_009006 [Clathrus columnatus]